MTGSFYNVSLFGSESPNKLPGFEGHYLIEGDGGNDTFQEWPGQVLRVGLFSTNRVNFT